MEINISRGLKSGELSSKTMTLISKILRDVWLEGQVWFIKHLLSARYCVKSFFNTEFYLTPITT